jgi:hypothetical protein
MSKVICLFFTLVVCKCALNAQTIEPSKGVDKNTLQTEIESIYSIEKDNDITIKSWSTPSLLFRYGFLKNVELQFNLPIKQERHFEKNELVYSSNALDDLQLGISINLWKQKKLLPETALMYRSLIHYQSDFKLLHAGQVISLNLSNTLNPKLTLTNNIGYAREKESSYSTFFVSNLSYSTSEKLSLFIEYLYTNTQQQNKFHNGLIGFGYAFTNKITFEGAVSKGLNYNQFYTGGRLTFVFENL